MLTSLFIGLAENKYYRGKLFFEGIKNGSIRRKGIFICVDVICILRLDDVSEWGGGRGSSAMLRKNALGQEDGTLSSLNRETSVKLFR